MTELNSHFEQLAAGLSVNSSGLVEHAGQLSDPRFEKPAGGLYWQVDVPGQESLRSRSLWDATLEVPTPPETAEEDHAHIMKLPHGGEIFSLERLLVLTSPDGKEIRTVVTVGLDREPIAFAAAEFAREITWGLAAVYVALLLGSFTMIGLGLQPLAKLREKLPALRDANNRLEGEHFPAEVVPLVQELNAVSNARMQQLERARTRAGNLAHGLKTPLMVLTGVAEGLKSSGQNSPARDIALQVGQMRDLVDRELVRSRMAGGRSGKRVQLAEICSRVVETMRRAPGGSQIDWHIAVPPQTTVEMDGTDLTELIGNLADNGRKHARSTVRIAHDGASLVVEDDGPGVSAEKLPEISRRGVRLDEKSTESAEGQGIGLAIVNDLAEAYQSQVTFERSDLGGLRVKFDLPARKQ